MKEQTPIEKVVQIVKRIIESWRRYNIDMDYFTGEITANEALEEYKRID